MHKGSRRPTAAQRLWAKLDTYGPIPEHRPELGPCWLWTGAKNSAGYGHLWVAGEYMQTHDFAYELLVGPIPRVGPKLKRTDVDHLCRVVACCRPEHLEVATHHVNILRGEAPAALNATKTHCPAGHPYSGPNLRIDTDGGRRCRACESTANARQRDRHRGRPLEMRPCRRCGKLLSVRNRSGLCPDSCYHIEQRATDRRCQGCGGPISKSNQTGYCRSCNMGRYNRGGNQ